MKGGKRRNHHRIHSLLAQLHARTGLEYLLVACRSTTEDFIKPYAYFSSDTIQGFFNSSLKRSVEEFSLQIEAYVMFGLKGVIENSKMQTLDLKKRTAALIGQKLRAITGVADLHTQYDRFDDLITEKHNVVIKNWPLGQKFCNPSVALTRIELGVLLNSWESGATRFEKLSVEEKRAWKNKHFSSKVSMMSLPPAASIPSASSASPALNPIMLSPSASTEPPATLPQVSIVTEMMLCTELAEQVAPSPTSNDAEVTSITPSTTQLPAPPELLAEMIRLDPTLQAIDPALIMADRGEFEVVTLELFNTRMAKVPRKGRKEKRAKKSMAGRENIPLVEGTGGQ
ncbi:hypothetical protein BJ322DRAFT_1024883 [Thelephora terrestris]|uniref:Uncharacterized protein n=1 Tax=Thelephora terrestris TaxID=56493 RepID=A0A9P6H3A9_9AGAM|nr:hypothetical protein BJ322DRAFT_1024883 [Thelephora terrestris]